MAHNLGFNNGQQMASARVTIWLRFFNDRRQRLVIDANIAQMPNDAAVEEAGFAECGDDATVRWPAWGQISSIMPELPL